MKSLFNGNIYKQRINLDPYISHANEIGDYITISGKNFYNPIFENTNIDCFKLFFRVKYKKTNAAVSRDKIEFCDFLTESGFANCSEVNLLNLIDRRKYVHVNTLTPTMNQYIVYFVNKKDEELYEGYLVFEAPTDRKEAKRYSSIELKLIKYLRKVLSI